MQNLPRFSLMRRILFPYSGEQPLTGLQCLRVVIAWMVFFPLLITLCALIFILPGASSLQQILTQLTFSFLSGLVVFGILGLLIVVMSNRAARIRQAWMAQNGRS